MSDRQGCSPKGGSGGAAPLVKIWEDFGAQLSSNAMLWNIFSGFSTLQVICKLI